MCFQEQSRDIFVLTVILHHVVTINLTLIGALVVTRAMLRHLTSRRCIILIIIVADEELFLKTDNKQHCLNPITANAHASVPRDMKSLQDLGFSFVRTRVLCTAYTCIIMHAGVEFVTPHP